MGMVGCSMHEQHARAACTSNMYEQRVKKPCAKSMREKHMPTACHSSLRQHSCMSNMHGHAACGIMGEHTEANRNMHAA